jgi:hypothetical protein
MEIFNNAWVVGIGGGILSGLFVTFITRYLFSKKDNSEYMQKVATVNREILYALRPGISEGHIPEESVLSALANSTARKYKVERNDIFQSKQIAEELIKEIMDSSFISSDTKKKYCETLAHLVKESLPENDVLALKAEIKVAESDYRQRLSQRMSMVLGMTAALITMLVGFKGLVDKPEIISPLKDIFELIIPTMSIITATLITMAAMLTTVRLKRLKDKQKENRSSET